MVFGLSRTCEGKFVFLLCTKRSQRPPVPGGVLEGLMQMVARGTAWFGAQHPRWAHCSPPPTQPLRHRTVPVGGVSGTKSTLRDSDSHTLYHTG